MSEDTEPKPNETTPKPTDEQLEALLEELRIDVAWERMEKTVKRKARVRSAVLTWAIVMTIFLALAGQRMRVMKADADRPRLVAQFDAERCREARLSADEDAVIVIAPQGKARLFRLELWREHGANVIWWADGVQRQHDGTVALLLKRSLLGSGRYRLSVLAGRRVVASYRITASDSSEVPLLP